MLLLVLALIHKKWHKLLINYPKHYRPGAIKLIDWKSVEMADMGGELDEETL